MMFPSFMVSALLALVQIVCFHSVPVWGVWRDTLQAQGLLGSYFGMANTPATYDYVIVGGGTAGLTLAQRLATNSSVAVIEAGGFYELDNGNASEIPALEGVHVGADPANINPLIDWRQYTTPQHDLDGSVFAYAQGKTLGGTSGRNGMSYHRSCKGAYQKWADNVGDQSYAWPNFLPYFQRSVNFTPPTANPRPRNATAQFDPGAYSPTGGPLLVSYPKWVYAFSSWVSLSLSHLGLKQVPGFVDGNLLGYSYIASTMDPSSATRVSSETAFLRTALQGETNLQVYHSTLAKKIIFSGKQAAGVVVETAGVAYNISAKKEVIVSGGSFRSPQLLMVSGVGPAATLQAHGIPLIADRPGVGQNMWDHLLFGPVYQVNLVTASQLGNPTFAAEQYALYDENRTGILTSTGGDLIGFEKLPGHTLSAGTSADLAAAVPDDWPTIELLTENGYSGNTTALALDHPANYAATLPALVAPFSRGNVTIQSANTADNPIVNPNWLTDPRDQEVAVAAFKRARQIMQTPSITPIIIGEEASPGINVTTDAEILAAIQNGSSTIYHAAATNAMGKADDKMAVVDSKARVIGVEKLRVVDASAFPFLPPGHPQATIYALAEKIAADILGSSK